MNAKGVFSALWLLALLSAVALTGLARVDPSSKRRTPAKGAVQAASAHYVTMADGKQGVADADGYVVPVGAYARIGSNSTVADDLLLALVEPERIVSLSEYGRNNAEEPYRWGKRPVTLPLSNLEGLLEQKPDLLVVNHMGSEAQLARAREAGIRIFNLGEMRGLSTLLPNIHAVSALLGVPERGERYAAKLARRMRSVADALPPAQRRQALYVSAYANKMYGGTLGTSYHDVLTHAGLIDVAASAYHDWPAYDPEQLLALDPELVVTQQGMSASVCAIHGLERLRACADGRKGFVEMPEGLMENPGPTMLDASEVLFERVYGSRSR